MNTTKRVVGIAFIWSAVTGSACAEAPTLINYQGRLLDDLGNPISSNVTVSVDIYTNETLGATVYSESVGTIVVNNGIYSL